MCLIVLLIVCLQAAACTSSGQEQNAPAPVSSVSPTPAPTPLPSPLVSFLREGALWVIHADGGGEQQLATPPPGEAINNHVWARDGSRIYYVIGRRYFSCSLPEVSGKSTAEIGELTIPAGTTIDRLELARTGSTLIAHAIPEDGTLATPPRVYATDIGRSEARELSVDEYARLAEPQPIPVRGFQDLSVSPDSHFILFKEVVGEAEELFIADVETGARLQVSDLAALDGFEPSASLSGTRYLLEAAWSPDGDFVVFNPVQSCSEFGLCYGHVFLLDVWSGVQYQLTREMTVSIPLEWSDDCELLAYDDGGQIVVADVSGKIRRLTEGNRPKIQPQSLSGRASSAG